MSRNAFEAVGKTGIYKIENRYSHKVYIGQAKDIAKRVSQHINNHNAAKDSIDEAINQLGVDAFTYEVIVYCEEVDLDYNEANQIYSYNSKDDGYNKTVGNGTRKEYDRLVKDVHIITAKLFKEIKNNFCSIHRSNQRFLLIGNFSKNILDYLDMNGCTYYNIYDNYEKEINNMFEKDFDIVISNPPYGKVGAKITRNIIENIDYKEFINLMPANDYHRGSDDLYKYVSLESMKSIRDGFKDAAVTTHMALINKKPDIFRTEEEFEIKNYTDRSLDKYFFENINRNHYAIDKMPVCGLTVKNAGIWDVTKTFIIGYRDMNHQHLPYTKDCTPYKWNVEESIDMAYIIATKPKSTEQLVISQCEFSSSIEKKNFVKFIYSKNGFRFMSKIFRSLNCDARVEHNAFPKVDWTKEWTVEELLVDYSYSEKEIKEIMDDLNNFKYMEE